MPSEYALSDLRGPVNPNLQNISNFYEGLSDGQIQHLDNAIKFGAGQSVNKMGSLDNFAHIKNAVGQYPDLRGVNQKMNDPQLFEQYGGKSGILDDIKKDLGNDFKGAWKGFWSDNPDECEELLPEPYRNQRYW